MNKRKLVGPLLAAIAVLMLSSPSHAKGRVYGNIGYQDYPWNILIGYGGHGGDYYQPHYVARYHHYHQPRHHRYHDEYRGHRRNHYNQYRSRHYGYERHRYNRHHYNHHYRYGLSHSNHYRH